jgi:cysteine dioxygenase
VRSRAKLPIDEWVRGLADTVTEFTEERVLPYMLDHGIEVSSLKPYMFFSSEGYTRNLVYTNDLFECLVLCWDVGQASPIHDHNDRLGWFRLCEGRLAVRSYRVTDRDALRRTCRVVATGTTELTADRAASVDREQAVHEVCNLARFDQRAISVHVNQQPMLRCEVYSQEHGTYELMSLTYTSELGQLKR